MDRYVTENFFGIEGFFIAWYGVIFALALIAGTLFALYRAKKAKIETEMILDLVIWTVPAALIGARLYYCGFEWEQYREEPWKILAIREGGLAIFGGVLGGVAALFCFCRIRKIKVLELLDLTAPCLLLGQVIGRWGNYTNQEAYGAVVRDPRFHRLPFAVFIEQLGEWHQAAFLYESASNALLLLLILITEKRRKRKGTVTALYLMGYGAIRFWVEGIRMDSLYLTEGIRVSQMLALGMIPVGVLVWAGTFFDADVR